MKKGVGYFDGSSIGKTGAYGYVIYFKKNGKIETIGGGDHMNGFVTSNEAEYAGLIGVLGDMLSRGFTNVHIRGDSQLIINQINGNYKVRKDTLVVLHKQAMVLVKRFKSIKLEHIKRDLNKAADTLSKVYNPAYGKKGDKRTHDQKVEDAIARIKAYEPDNGYMLGFSGGKDSLVIYHLAKMSGVRFDPVYNITGVDPPELIKFIKKNYPDVKKVKPLKTMWDLIPSKLMPPTRHNRYCCYYLKETASDKGRVVITGVRAEESRMRSGRKVYSYNSKLKSISLNPIVDWTEEDVWGFLEKNDIAYCDLYDDGFTRLGCIGCPMTNRKTIEKEFQRYPTIEKKYRKAMGLMLENRKAKGLETTWQNVDEVMDWWLDT